MKKILKYLLGKSINLNNLSLNFQLPDFIKPPIIPYSYYLSTGTKPKDYTKLESSFTSYPEKKNLWNQVAAIGLDVLNNYTGLQDIFGDSEVGQALGTIFSSGVNSGVNTMASNLIKGNALSYGLGKDVGSSLAGTGVGLVSNYIGQGITSALGDSTGGRAFGAGTATALGGLGGTALSNIINGEKAFSGLFTTSLKTIDAVNNLNKLGKYEDAANLMKSAKYAKMANIGGLAGQVVGSALSAATGPSKEYGGEYGTGTQIADTAYDAAQTAVGFMGPVGALVSGGMALNKGLSNVFGSTDGMTVQDSILGSAWMPFPVKWINMWGARTTTPFKNQSWLNTEKTNAFMGNAFGDLGEKFEKARKEAGKTYGTFSRSAYHRALDNLNYANNAWGTILNMADLNEIQNIRSLLMTSINNQRYAQNIQGGWNPVYRGKQGMKIFNNATNHKIGMRLLSGAALIDSKQMILCGAVD